MPHTRGFTNIFRMEYAVVNLDALAAKFETGAVVTPEMLVERGLIDHPERVKVLGRGELGKPLTVRAHAFSESAKAKIAAAGGQVEVISQSVN